MGFIEWLDIKKEAPSHTWQMRFAMSPNPIIIPEGIEFNSYEDLPRSSSEVLKKSIFMTVFERSVEQAIKAQRPAEMARPEQMLKDIQEVLDEPKENTENKPVTGNLNWLLSLPDDDVSGYADPSSISDPIEFDSRTVLDTNVSLNVSPSEGIEEEKKESS